MTWLRLISALAIYLALAAQAGAQDSGNPTMDIRLSPMDLSEIRYWAYQIQGLSREHAVEELAGSRYDLLVIEPTRTDWSSDDRYFDTRAAVERLKGTPASDGVHRKLVLAYIDIGQAEDWRWYFTWPVPDFNDPDFTEMPSFFAAPDPDGWDGNYVVHYWDQAWRDIVIFGSDHAPEQGRDYVSIMDEVLKDGFDGVYLDWVEAFENEAVIAEAERLGLDPVHEMYRLIRDLAEYGRNRSSGFIVIQQNGSALAVLEPSILDVVDGIAQEGVWFEGIATDDWNDPQGCDEPVDPEWTGEYLDHLALYLDRGLLVLNCEYACARADEAYARSLEAGFIPYATRRSLGRLSTTPPPGY